MSTSFFKLKTPQQNFAPDSNATMVSLHNQITLSSSRPLDWLSWVVKNGKSCPLKMCSIYPREKQQSFFKVTYYKNQNLLRLLQIRSVCYHAVIGSSEKFQRVENPICSIITTKQSENYRFYVDKFTKLKRSQQYFAPGSNATLVSLDNQITLSFLRQLHWLS